MIINQIKDRLNYPLETYQAIELTKEHSVLENILSEGYLLIVFPLYVDSLPAPLTKVLTMLEEAAKLKPQTLPKVFAVCNCGYFESHQISGPIEILRNFCSRVGFYWGHAIAIGAGGFFSAKTKNLSKGPASKIAYAFDELCSIINGANSCSRDNVFVEPQIPRFLYMLSGNLFWIIQGKKNGVLRQIKATPYL